LDIIKLVPELNHVFHILYIIFIIIPGDYLLQISMSRIFKIEKQLDSHSPDLVLLFYASQQWR